MQHNVTPTSVKGVFAIPGAGNLREKESERVFICIDCLVERKACVTLLGGK